jgi:hypothetical protein
MNTAASDEAMASSRHIHRFAAWAPACAGVTRSFVP